MKVDKRQLRIQRRRVGKLSHRLYILVAIQVRLAHEEMKLRRIPANLHQMVQSPLLEIRELGVPGRYSQHVQVCEIPRLFRPQKLQRMRGLRIFSREKVAKSEKIPRLSLTGGSQVCRTQVRRLFPHHRF